MTASPELKLTELIDRLNHLAKEDSPSEFVLKKIQKEARILAKTDAYAAYITQGIIATINADTADVINYHEKSLRLRDDAYTKVQYACSLGYVGQFSKSISLYESAYKAERDNLKFLDGFISDTIYGIQFHRASELLKDWDKMKPGDVRDDDELILSVKNFMDELNISDKDLVFVSQAFEAVIEKGYRIKAWKIKIRDEDDFKWLDFEYLIQATMEEVLELNYQLSKKIVENVTDSKILERVVIRFGEYANAI